MVTLKNITKIVFFESVEIFSSVETWVLKLLRLRLSIKAMSEIETLSYRDIWVLGFETVMNLLNVKNFSTWDYLDWLTIKTWILKMLRSRLLIETMSKIETSGYKGSIKTLLRNCQGFLGNVGMSNVLTAQTWVLTLLRMRSWLRRCQKFRL